MSISRPQLFISRLCVSIYMTTICFLFPLSHKKGQFILPLCSSKIAWHNYATLQMISEYFPARGRSLNRAKRLSSFVEFGHAQNEPPYWIWMLLDPGNECYNPWCNAVKRAVVSTVKRKRCEDTCIVLRKGRKWCLKATTSGSFGSGNNCKYTESQAFWIRTYKKCFWWLLQQW